MNPNNPSTPPNDVATWFQGVQGPDPIAPPPSPKKNRRPLIIGVLGACLLLVGAIIALLAATGGRTGACLTSSDYTSLTGDKVDAATMSPTTNFYTSAITFKPVAAALDESGTTSLNKIADFYKNHPDTSIMITIKSTYSANSALPLTEERIAAVKAGLTAGGVAESSITAPVPEYLIPEEDAAEDSSSILISITSNEKCS